MVSVKKTIITSIYIISFWLALPLLLINFSRYLNQFFSKKTFPLLLRLAGFQLTIAGSLLLKKAIKDFSKGAGKLPITALPPYNRIATKGLYSLWRHPVYLFYTITTTGIALIFSSRGFLYLLLPLFVSLEYCHARIEEMWLLKKFGSRYKNYMNQTSLFIPKRTQLNRLMKNILCKRSIAGLI